jgi:hypothetical protein
MHVCAGLVSQGCLSLFNLRAQALDLGVALGQHTPYVLGVP